MLAGRATHWGKTLSDGGSQCKLCRYLTEPHASCASAPGRGGRGRGRARGRAAARCSRGAPADVHGQPRGQLLARARARRHAARHPPEGAPPFVRGFEGLSLGGSFARAGASRSLAPASGGNPSCTSAHRLNRISVSGLDIGFGSWGAPPPAQPSTLSSVCVGGWRKPMQERRA